MKKVFIFFIVMLLTFSLAGCDFWRFGSDTEEDEVKPGEMRIGDIPGTSEDDRIAVENIQAVLRTSMGEVRVSFFPAETPRTIMNFANLAKADFYDGTTFHRVIEGFMIQVGDPNSRDEDKSNDGQGGPDYTFEDEINPKVLGGLSEEDISALEAEGYAYNYDIPSSHNVVRGVMAMANSGPNTNGSQFFILTGDEAPWLDGRHTVFGEVVSGMDIVDAIEVVEVDENSNPLEDIVLEKVIILINDEVDEYDAGTFVEDDDRAELDDEENPEVEGVDSGDAGDVGDAGDAGDDDEDGGETTDGEDGTDSEGDGDVGDVGDDDGETTDGDETDGDDVTDGDDGDDDGDGDDDNGDGELPAPEDDI